MINPSLYLRSKKLVRKEKYLRWNHEGLIPKLEESFQAFEERAFSSSMTFTYEYSKENLNFYELACTLIDENQTIVQLHPRFKNQQKFLSVDKNETIEHEKVHFIRRSFTKDRYEESIAYLTSSSKYRRALGGMFKNPKEIKGFFLMTLLLPPLGWIFDQGEKIMGLMLLTLGFFIFRGLKKYFLLQKIIKKLNQISSGRGIEFLFRLEDEEINLFSYLCAAKIETYYKSFPSSPKKEMMKWAYLDR